MEADVPLRQKSNNHKLCGDAKQQGHSLSNQTGSSLNFNSIIFQKRFWGS